MALTKKPATKVGQSAAKPAAKSTPAPAKPAATPKPQPKQEDTIEEGKRVAPAQPQNLSTSVIDLAADAEQYEQQFDRQDVATPFLQILQALSPQVVKGGEGYIEGAEAGMIYNTATKELWDGLDEGIVFIPASYSRTFIEWVTRENGGGFVADHGLARGEQLLQTTTKDDKKRNILANGNQLVESAIRFGIIYSAEGVSPDLGVCMTMTSTQLKASRGWNTKCNSVMVQTPNGPRRAPLFSQCYRLRTELQKNDQGQWYGWVIESNGPTIETLGEEWYLLARELAQSVRSGAVEVKHDQAAETGAVVSDGPTPF